MSAADASTSTAPAATATVKVFRPASSSGLQSTKDLPESYFAPTTHELAVAHTSQAKTSERLADAPLLTKRLRDDKASSAWQAKRAKYPQARIRVKFADQTMVETVLPSSESVAGLYAFVKSILNEAAQPASFLLYQTPPRREFKAQDPQSLLELDLAPSAMLYIKFDQADLNNGNAPPPLRSQLLESIQELPASQEAPTPPEPTNKRENTASDASKERKVPKWLNKAIGKK